MDGATGTPARQGSAPINAGPGSPADANGAPKRKRVACTSCRESKVRCIGPLDRCARCERLEHVCRTDAAFKRSNKRSKVEALEKQVEQLLSAAQRDGRGVSGSPRPSFTAAPQPSIGASDGAPSTPRATEDDASRTGFPNPDSSGPRDRIADVAQDTAQPPIAAERPIGPSLEPVTTTRRVLEGIEVSPAQIDSLFRLYFARFHPFLPFLDTTRSPDQYYDSSLLLFWAIIAVAARRHRDYPRLLESLTVPVSNLLWKTVQASSMDLLNLYPVQGFIILCSWPIPTNRVWTDPSLLLSNIAVTSCIQLGLHRPEHPKEFLARPSRQYNEFVVDEEETNERMRTWAACNIINQSVMSDFGHGPSGYCFDQLIDQACDIGLGAYALPNEIRHGLIIQRFCYRVSKAMMAGANSTGIPLEHDRYLQLMLLEEELNVIEQQLGNQLSEINLLRHCEARLYLNLYHFIDSSLIEPRRNGILKAYNAASALITRIISSSSENAGWYDRLLYAPVHNFRLILTASVVLNATLNSTYSEYVDYASGKLLFNSALFAVRRMSMREGDGPERGAGFLGEMWKSFEASFRQAPQEPRIRIRARMAASLTYDTFLRRHLSSSLSLRGVNVAGDKGLPTQVGESEQPNEGDAGLMSDSIMDYWQEYPNPSFLWDEDFPNTLTEFMA